MPITLTLVHQNIQGLSGKDLEIELFLEKFRVDIFCITEHWLKNYEMLFNYENYNMSSAFNRKILQRGGSLVFIRKTLKAKERKDIVNLSIEGDVELACIELEKHIVLCVYRSPYDRNFTSFEAVMEDALGKISNSGKSIVVCGDFNVDLLDKDISTRIICLFKSFDLDYVFLEPTRITSTTATCIDNVYCNCNVTEKKVINCLKSDHSGLLVKLPFRKIKKEIKTQTRPVTIKKIEKFKLVLNKKLPIQDFTQSNTDNYYNGFFAVIDREFQNIFKTKSTLINQKFKFSAWATTGIRKSRETLFDLYDKKTYTFDDNFINYIKAYSKIFKKVCSVAKSNYIANKIKLSENKVKMVWNIINRETGKVKTRDPVYVLQTDHGKITDNTEIAKEFETYFTNIPVKTTEALNSSPLLAQNLLEVNVNRCTSLFTFKSINPYTVVKAFKSLKLKNTEDLWGLSVTLISNVINILAPYLACLFNISIESGVFPALMKLSKVVPLYKSGSKTDSGNYRPVSVLPVLSKVFEKIMLNQMVLHFNENGLLHNRQYGFTKGRSTTDAGVELVRNIYDAFEESQNAIGVFCDLSKAFDCVEHQTLLLKLKHYGVEDRAIRLLKSYLDNRTQKVEINGTYSSGSNVKMGVPQGSILGPFLFLTYINDLPFMVENLSNIVLFADDTSLLFKVDRKVKETDEVNSTLSKILSWFTTNNLLLNAKKTKCMRFTLPNVKLNQENVILDGNKLEYVSSTVFLGITIDCKLQWGPHITTLAGRLSSAAYAVKKIRQLTDIATARLVYFSYFHSVMSYGILLWGHAADIDTIFVLQKRAVRAIYKMRSRESLRDRFKEIHILTVAGQFIYENIMYVRKNIHLFSRNSDRHNLNLRNKNKLEIIHTRLSKISKSFVGQCIRFYNKIPENICELTEKKFKNHVKKCISSKGYYKIHDYLNDKEIWTASVDSQKKNYLVNYFDFR